MPVPSRPRRKGEQQSRLLERANRDGFAGRKRNQGAVGAAGRLLAAQHVHPATEDLDDDLGALPRVGNSVLLPRSTRSTRVSCVENSSRRPFAFSGGVLRFHDCIGRVLSVVASCGASPSLSVVSAPGLTCLPRLVITPTPPRREFARRRCPVRNADENCWSLSEIR